MTQLLEMIHPLTDGVCLVMIFATTNPKVTDHDDKTEVPGIIFVGLVVKVAHLWLNNVNRVSTLLDEVLAPRKCTKYPPG